jgi:large subunit ribosomal protein L25
MSEMLKIEVTKRADQGTSAARRLRAAGRTPAVVYGGKGEATAVDMDSHEFAMLVQHHGTSMILELTVDGDETRNVMVKEVQFHPVSGVIDHVDFMEVSMTETIVATVPVVLVGESPGEALGGVLEQLISEVEVECLPMALPSQIEIDISHLEFGHHLSVADIDAGEGVAIVTDGDVIAASVHEPRVSAAAAAAAAEEGEGGEAAGEGEEAAEGAAQPAGA